MMKVDQMAESASGLVDSKFDCESRQTIDLKVGIHGFPAWHSALKGQCGEIRQVSLVCCWEECFTEFHIL